MKYSVKEKPQTGRIYLQITYIKKGFVSKTYKIFPKLYNHKTNNTTPKRKRLK